MSGGFPGAAKFHLKWEALCAKCGLCCYDRYHDAGGKLVVDLSAPCEHLDPEKMICKVYARRFKVCEDCRKVTVFHALFSRYLPQSCGYVRTFRPWKRYFSSRGIDEISSETS